MIEADPRFDLLLETGTVASIRDDPALARWHRGVFDSGRAGVDSYDADGTHPSIVTDDTVHLALPGEDGTDSPRIDTDDDEVLAWARATSGKHRDTAVPLSADDGRT